MLYQQREHTKETAVREKEWALERGALLSRIQHPEVYYAQPTRDEIYEGIASETEDEIDLIGTVVSGEMNGDGDGI